ncbi:type IV pilin protein [Paraburkholderia rhizosphaerae]|uniref:Type IV pilus assembly protein PilE n=1 Tax=Paraburkholderia rhizosphaerae TaxID=480658 RepID=A0A4R8LCV0_9BURK|nr:type IV pilin protein [Paraburkholderia rhizosphaerae]TDY40375.1 type IV pilus assembly protein PilE [Paraburkholderia rhizosphaerae]
MKLPINAFTLLELVIALAIIAVLAAFAVPSYRAQISRGHRMDAAAALYRAAQFVESAPRGGGTIMLPSGFDQVPQSGAAVYRLQMLPADDANGGYTLEARPTEAGPMHDDRCGIFALDATGLRSNRASATSGAPVDLGSGASSGNTLSVDSVQCWSAR